MNSELDRIFDKGLSEVTRAPKVPLSDEQIAAAAKESRSGAGVWLLMHAKEILLCAVSVAVGIGGTLLVTHLIGNRDTVPTPTETTTGTTNTAMVAEDTVTFMGETNVDAVETLHATSQQTDPNTASVETRRAESLQNDRHTPSVTDPVIVKKTVIQRDTVVINETVTLKDTVYVP